MSPVKHIVVAWRKLKLNHMLEVEEFREDILFLSDKSVLRSSSFREEKPVISADRVKLAVTISSPLHESRCFQVLGNKHCTKITTACWQNDL